jgi:hypothetical protein
MKSAVTCSGNVETIANSDSCSSELISYYEDQITHSVTKIFVQDVTERIIHRVFCW